MMKSQYISFRRAVKLLCDGSLHSVKFWKKNGEVVEIRECVKVGGSRDKGNILVYLPASHERRLLIDVNLFEIDGQEILL